MVFVWESSQDQAQKFFIQYNHLLHNKEEEISPFFRTYSINFDEDVEAY